MSSKTETRFSFPYPVLGDGVSVVGDPSLKVTELDTKGTAWEDCYSYHIEFCVCNEDIERRIANGEAVCMSEVYCIDTPYRKGFCGDSKASSVDVHVPKSCVLGRMVIRNVVVASTAINGYSNSQAADWFSDLTFDINIGEPLAILPELQYDNQLQTASRAPLSSWITVKPTAKDMMFYSEISDKISINLPDSVYQKFCKPAVQAKKENELVIISGMALGAVAFAISKYAENEGKDYAWVKALRSVFDEDDYSAFDPMNMSIDECFHAAQMILKDPVGNLINQLDSQSMSST